MAKIPHLKNAPLADLCRNSSQIRTKQQGEYHDSEAGGFPGGRSPGLSMAETPNEQ